MIIRILKTKLINTNDTHFEFQWDDIGDISISTASDCEYDLTHIKSEEAILEYGDVFLPGD